MPKWFLGKRHRMSSLSYKSTPPDLNSHESYIKYEFGAAVQQNYGEPLQDDLKDKRTSQINSHPLNRDQFSRASPDSGYSHSPLSYSYFTEQENTDREDTAALLKNSNNPLDLSSKMCRFKINCVAGPDAVKSEPSVDSESQYFKEILNDIKAVDGDNIRTMAHCQTHPGGQNEPDNFALEQEQELAGCPSYFSDNLMANRSDDEDAARRHITLLYGKFPDDELRTTKKSKYQEDSNDYLKDESCSGGRDCDIDEKYGYRYDGTKNVTCHLEKLFNHRRIEDQNQKCRDAVTYHIHDLTSRLSTNQCCVRFEIDNHPTPVIPETTADTIHKISTDDDIRQSDKIGASQTRSTASVKIHIRKEARTKSKKLNKTTKSSKLLCVKKNDVLYKCDVIETLCRGDLDSSLTLVDATPEARAELEKIENKIGDYACMLCCERFCDAFQLAGHNCSGIVHIEYRCPECSKIFNCPANLASHRRWHKPPRNSQAITEWSLDELLKSTHYLERLRMAEKLGRPILL